MKRGLFVYYEPIKDNFYITAYWRGLTPKTLKWGISETHISKKWYFNKKWGGHARFHFIGRL